MQRIVDEKVKRNAGPHGLGFSGVLAETGSEGDWPKNASAPRLRPQEMPIRPVGVCGDQNTLKAETEFGLRRRTGWTDQWRRRRRPLSCAAFR